MNTSTTDDDGESANYIYNYIYSYRIPVLIIVYLVACTKAVEKGRVQMISVSKTTMTITCYQLSRRIQLKFNE